MKKTLLAFLVAGAATSANAAVTVYDNDGISVDVTGAAEVQVYKDYGDNPDTDIRLDDGDIGVSAKLQLNQDWYALGAFAYAFESQGSGDVYNDELYVGIGSDTYGQLTIGRQYLLVDDAGIGKDYEFGTGGVDFVLAQGDEVYKYVYDNGSFYFGTSGLVQSSGGTYLPDSGEEVSVNDTEAYDARIGFRYAGLDARFYYFTGQNVVNSLFVNSDGTNQVLDSEAYSVEAEYQVTDAVGVAASWSQIDYDSTDGSGRSREADVWQVAADYQWNNTNFAAGFNLWDDTDVNGVEEVDARTYYLNVTQRIHRFAKVYAEVGYLDEDEVDENVAYLVGMEVAF